MSAVNSSAGAVAVDISAARFQAGVARGQWRVIASEFPLLFVAIAAIEPDGTTSEYSFRLELTGFPGAAPEVRIWDCSAAGPLPQARRPQGSPRVIEAFKTWGHVANYQKFRVNVFGKERDPAQHFAGVEDDRVSAVKELMRLPAYKELALSQNDGGCAAAMLAERSVAVPFVSAFVGSVVMTQAIRIGSGEAPCVVLTGNLGDLRTVRATMGKPAARINFACSLAPANASLSTV